MFNLTFSLTFLLAFINLCNSFNILVVYPFPAGSHNNLGNGVIKHLVRAGHEVTYITPFPSRISDHQNLRIVDVTSVKDALDVGIINIKKIMDSEGQLNDDNGLFHAIMNVSEAVVKHENVQKLLNDPKQNFDVVVTEWMFTELYAGFAVTFDCPYLWTFPYEPYVNVLTLIDEAPNPAYVSNLVSNNVPPFTFMQRLQELISNVKTIILRTYYQLPIESMLYEEVFKPVLQRRGRTLPPYNEVRYNSSMMLGLWHVSTGQTMSLPQNFKSIAGFYIDENVKPLPEDLQRLMDNAKDGVIYFSMGSNLKSKDFPEVIQKELIKMLGELKQEVLWKFETPLKDLPKNVHIMQWAPQQSVLAHPNCKLFITHGGLLSMTEAVYFGVPIVGIPVFTDQFNNINRAVHKGSGKRVDISYSLAKDLGEAIREITSDSTYMSQAKELSIIFHDRPVSAGAELVHWVEHVVRTRGAPHLRSPALHMPFYQKMYLDLIVVLIVILFIAKKILKLLVSICFAKKQPIVHKKNN